MSSITKVLTKNSVAKSAILEDRNKSRALSKSRQSTGIGIGSKMSPDKEGPLPTDRFKGKVALPWKSKINPGHLAEASSPQTTVKSKPSRKRISNHSHSLQT
jgi:hypothetical protein